MLLDDFADLGFPNNKEAGDEQEHPHKRKLKETNQPGAGHCTGHQQIHPRQARYRTTALLIQHCNRFPTVCRRAAYITIGSTHLAAGQDSSTPLQLAVQATFSTSVAPKFQTFLLFTREVNTLVTAADPKQPR